MEIYKIEEIKKKLESIKKRSREKNLDFNLTVEWFLEKISLGKCEETGLSFDFSTHDSKKGVPPYKPTVDRTDSNKGYTIDNCKLVVMIYNQAKNETSKEELKSWARKFIERYENETLLG